MNLKKYIFLVLCFLPLMAGAQGVFLGKRMLIDANVYTSSKAFRPFDVDEQILVVNILDEDDFLYDEHDDGYLTDDGTYKEIEKKKFWDCNIFFSASIETMLWRKGSVMLEARFLPYSDFIYEDAAVLYYRDNVYRMAEERSFEAGIGYRQYMFKTSCAPYGRYIQVGVNKLQVQWRHNCLSNDAIETLENINSKYKTGVVELKDRFKTEQKAGYEDLWAGYVELGYNHLFLNNRLRVSLAMRSEFPFLSKAEDEYPNVGYNAVRHFWSTNIFSLRAGVGFLLF